VEDKFTEMGVLLPPVDENVLMLVLVLVLVLDTTVAEVFTSSSEATIVRSIILSSLCLQMYSLRIKSLLFALVKEYLDFVYC